MSGGHHEPLPADHQTRPRQLVGSRQDIMEAATAAEQMARAIGSGTLATIRPRSARSTHGETAALLHLSVEITGQPVERAGRGETPALADRRRRQRHQPPIRNRPPRPRQVAIGPVLAGTMPLSHSVSRQPLKWSTKIVAGTPSLPGRSLPAIPAMPARRRPPARRSGRGDGQQRNCPRCPHRQARRPQPR